MEFKLVREETEIEFNKKYYEALNDFINDLSGFHGDLETIALMAASLLALGAKAGSDNNLRLLMDVKQMPMLPGEVETMVAIVRLVDANSQDTQQALKLFAVAISSMIMNLMDRRRDEEEKE